MAARILEDILCNELAVDNVIEWLSNFKNASKIDVKFKNYDCSQVQFVSYFLSYLREQSSRNFQVNYAETPTKSTSSRKIKNLNCDSASKSNFIKPNTNSSIYSTELDLESLQSFPNLSSCSSSKGESVEKVNFNNSLLDFSNKGSADSKLVKVKLFSETLEVICKDDSENKIDKEICYSSNSVTMDKFAMSTPCKTLMDNSLYLSSDYFDFSYALDNLQNHFVKSLEINNSKEISSSEVKYMIPRSKSFGNDSFPKSKNNKTDSKMSLGDFITSDVNVGDLKKERKNKGKKKINLTKINDHGKILNEKDENMIGKNTNFLMQMENTFENKNFNENKKSLYLKNGSCAEVGRQPNLELVTHTNELKILSEIYSFLISENYCQNIMVEFCFIISLLVIKECDKKMPISGSDLIEKNFFGSIDNCVYFAVKMLWLQRQSLLHLNFSALRLLSENIRIEKFNRTLKEFFTNACAQSHAREDLKKSKHGLIKMEMQGNVSFQYETDNRENFTSDISFHSFKKQRDLFYNILANWEANHLVNGWIFSVGLGAKIRSLMSICSEPINLLHLARLFRDQLITSCCVESQIEDDLNEEILQLLPSADPNKILRLRARLINSSSRRQGPCPLPDFSGHQEFYKDFILHTGSSVFHEHLKNSLCDEILKLNDTDLVDDVEDEESSLDEQTEKRFFQCLNILRLLAKFLGFLEFMPYRGEKMFTERISNIHCSVRNCILPLFDVTLCLQTAITKKNLILTVPWIVSYLSMIDPYSARLKIYREVWRQLIIIYKYLKAFKNVKNRFFLTLVLGWIFQLPSFPPDQFYSVLDDNIKKASVEIGNLSFLNIGETGLDSYNFIDETVLYVTCPYLNEINIALNENSSCNVRHIRPTTHDNSFTKTQASKQLQLRLEGNFLHNQSSSTRKTIEFVTERVASIAIKHLIYKTLPKFKQSFSAKLDKYSLADNKEKNLVVENLSGLCYEELLSVCRKEYFDVALKRSKIALKALLSSDLQPSVTDTCTKIAARQAVDKIEGWMQSHVTLAMIQTELVSLIKKKTARKGADTNVEPANSFEVLHESFFLPKDSCSPDCEKENINHNKARPASQMIKTVKEWICRIRSDDICPSDLEEVIEEASSTILHRDDMTPAAEKILFTLLLDLVVIFCIHSKSCDISNVFKKFILLLNTTECKSQCCLERIICPRNVALIFNECKNREFAWKNLSTFLHLLLEKNLVDKKNLEVQFLMLFRYPYERVEGENYAKFISIFLDQYTKIYGLDKFSLLLDCIKETLNEEDSKSNDFT